MLANLLLACPATRTSSSPGLGLSWWDGAPDRFCARRWPVGIAAELGVVSDSAVVVILPGSAAAPPNI